MQAITGAVIEQAIVDGLKRKKRKDEVHVKVTGRIDGTVGGTLTIHKERQLVSIRPKGRRREYELPLSFVAEIIVAKVVKQELGR